MTAGVYLVVGEREPLELAQLEQLLRDQAELGVVQSDPLQVDHLAHAVQRQAHVQAVLVQVQAPNELGHRHDWSSGAPSCRETELSAFQCFRCVDLT